MLKAYSIQQIKLQYRDLPSQLLALLFFAFIIFMLPIITTTDQMVLSRIAPGIIWFAAVFSQSLELAKFFQNDHYTGLLECYFINAPSATLLMLIRLLIYSWFHLIPLLIMSWIGALVYQLDLNTTLMLTLSLCLGIPILDMLGACCNALLLNSRQGSLLLLLLVLPLYVPLVIFATSMVNAYQLGLPVFSSISLLAGIFCLSLSCLPSVIAYGLRLSIES